GEEDGVVAPLADGAREHVDAWLRERRLERRVVGDEAPRRAERPRAGRERANARAADDARDVRVAERGGLREHAEGAFLELVAVVLEEDEDGHQRSFRSRRNSRIRSAAVPSSWIRTESPRGGGSETA